MGIERGSLPSTGDRDLDALFVGAEKWIEIETDDSGHLAAIRVFVRHPQHTGCNALVEMTPVTTKDTAPGVRVSTWQTKRTTTDDGTTPAAAIAQLARMTQRCVIELKSRGGPKGTPLGEQKRMVAGWLAGQRARSESGNLRRQSRHFGQAPATVGEQVSGIG